MDTLLLQGLRSGGVRVPDTAAERELTLRCQRRLARGMRQLDAMRRATAALAGRRIPTLILKGLPLGQRLYGSPFAKISKDIDLLVPPHAFAAAGRVLLDIGWRRSMPRFRETPARTRWCDEVLEKHDFIGPGGNLDLHRNLLNPFLFDPSFMKLDANAATIEIAGNPFRTLGDADQLLYLACHGSLHYWQRLKWLCDFAMLVRSIDADTLAQTVARGRALGLDRALTPALLLCRKALHVENAPAAAALCRHGPRTRFVVGLSQRTWTPCGRLRQIVRKATMRAGKVLVGSGIRYSAYEIRTALIRPRDFGRVDLPDCLFWLYVPLRPVLLVLRVLRGRS